MKVVMVEDDQHADLMELLNTMLNELQLTLVAREITQAFAAGVERAGPSDETDTERIERHRKREEATQKLEQELKLIREGIERISGFVETLQKAI